MGVKFPGKKRYVTLEWPLMPVARSFPNMDDAVLDQEFIYGFFTIGR